MDRANEQIRARAIDEAERSLRYLADQIQATSSVELRDSLFKLVETEQRKRMLATVRPNYAFDVIDHAVISEQRVSPHRVALVIAMAILGLFMGVTIVIVRAIARTR